MIFHRLRVLHYKGIAEREIAFAPTGVTLVEGRNEIGKSSMVQAISTLFDEPAGRQRQKLIHLIPKDGGGVPEIELEAESGPYRFVFHKRFVENKVIELRLLSPRDETISGKEAQERFEKILGETLDRTLWSALMLQQGAAVGLPEVDGQRALMAALDSAVAGPAGNRDHESVYARVEEEYAKYYHGGHHGELQHLRDLRDAAEKARERERDIFDRASDLEARIKTAKNLRQALLTLEKREREQKKALDDSSLALAGAEQIEKALLAARTVSETASAARRRAARELEERRELAAALRKSGEGAAEADKAIQAARSGEAEASRNAGEHKRGLAALLAERERLEELARRCRADYDHFRDRLELERLRERKDRIDASAALVAEAKRELAANRITAQAMKDIDKLEREALLARTRLEGAAARVEITALGNCSVLLDGNEEMFSAGDVRRMPVIGTTELAVPGILTLRMTSGTGGGKLEKDARLADEAFRKALADHGVSSPEEIPELAAKRRAAEEAIAGHRRIEEENLRDLPYSGSAGGLVERIRELEWSVAAHAPAPVAGHIPAADLDAAKTARDLAEAAARECAERCRGAETGWSAAEAVRLKRADELARLEAEHEATRRERERRSHFLDESRARVSDTELEEAFNRANDEFATAAGKTGILEDQLRDRQPELLRARNAVLTAAIAKTAEEKARTGEELARLGGELQFLGGEGLGEKLDAARAEAEHGERMLAAELRRAEAAKLLWEVMTAERERSQRSYVQPLRRQIEDLARSVYATDVGVALDDNLRITARTMNGVEIGFAELSGGAREQFSLIHRAACSLIVAKDGGVPLILDDALGYSDSERLIGMNEVLSRAAQRCQIIILTCMPDRYGYLEPARRIVL